MSHYLHYLSIWLDEGVGRYLSRLKAVGLYGENEDDVIRTLIQQGVQRAVERGVIAVEFAEVEGVEEAPAPPPVKPPCATCNDQWDKPGVCPTCGSDGIPF